MGRIRFRALHIDATLIVKPEHLLGIALPRLRRSHVLNPVSFPQAIAVAKRLKPAFAAYSGTGKN